MLKNLHSNFRLLNNMNLSEIKSLDINISFQETKGQRHESLVFPMVMANCVSHQEI